MMKHTIRRIMICVIIAILSLVAITGTAFARDASPNRKKASDPNISNTKVTMAIGYSVKLKVNNYKGKIIWKTSNKSIASVTKKGIVVSKNEGVANITAKAGRKVLTCKVVVIDKPKVYIDKTSRPLKKPYKVITKRGKYFVLNIRGTAAKVTWMIPKSAKNVTANFYKPEKMENGIMIKALNVGNFDVYAKLEGQDRDIKCHVIIR